MNKIFLLGFSFFCFGALAQTDSIKAVKEIRDFQNKLNADYKNRDESPLEPKDLKKFKGHPFFKINLAYRVNAKLTPTPNTGFFPMKTTTSRLPNYRVYGMAEFTVGGKVFKLPVYQSENLLGKEEYTNYLFFTFTDLSNGEQTYSGGRYIDLYIPKEGEALIIDFNQAYNPFCAYNHKYSCPVVPRENHIDIEIAAGVMYEQKRY